jgi:hypothetical protein
MKMALRRTPLNEQEAAVVSLHRDEKRTFREIAAQLGVSSVRARQIFRAANARLNDFAENGDDALSRLPQRAITLLTKLDIATRAQTRIAIESGRLSWCEQGRGAMCYDGMPLRLGGWITWTVLHAWTGLQRPTQR